MKIVVIVAFVAILGSLAGALFFMMRRSDDEDNDRRSKLMARALTLRIGFSVLLFLLVLLSWHMGWIQPTGLPRGR